ncbi:MAG: hypothetical protein HRU38_09320 [Saccharospirillaceae bacterium]|nr:hypothetical protein [Pseudomonadales bacterium]NRB78853.1 hypothetical protein [Saccharospirillaceae bacterium]
MSRSILITVSVLSCLVFQSCEPQGNTKQKHSTFGDDESHKMGQDCMNCHNPTGEGEGSFTIAGTVYQGALSDIVQPNALVKLYSETGSQGSIIAELEVDGLGNFYTTKEIDLSAHVFPQLSKSDNSQAMITSTNKGNCNSCHGVTTDKIWLSN